jgi:hypothetical protein
VLLAALAAGGWYAWQRHPEWFAAVTAPSRPAPSDAPPPLAVCALPAPAAVEQALGAAVAAPGGAAQGVPAAGSCTWTTPDGGLVSAMVFTRASLATGAGAQRLHGRAYFDTVATGLEYALKQPPQRVDGLGDAAVAAGFDAGAGQLVVLKGETVLHLTSSRVERPRVERLARAVAARL